MGYTRPRTLSENEAKMIFIDCFFRTIDIMKRLCDVGIYDTDKANGIYREFQDTWKDITLGYKRDLVLLAKNIRDGKYDCSNLWDPRHVNGDGYLKTLLSKIEGYEYFTNRVENKAREWQAKVNTPESPQLFLDHKTSFLNKMLEPNLSKADLERLSAIVDKIVEKNKKIRHLEKTLNNDHIVLTPQDREKYSKYLEIYQKENQEETKKITKYMPKPSNKMDDWLFGKGL